MLFKSLIKKILDKLLPSKLAIAEKTEITEMLVDMQKRVEQGTEKIDSQIPILQKILKDIDRLEAAPPSTLDTKLMDLSKRTGASPEEARKALIDAANEAYPPGSPKIMRIDDDEMLEAYIDGREQQGMKIDLLEDIIDRVDPPPEVRKQIEEIAKDDMMKKLSMPPDEFNKMINKRQGITKIPVQPKTGGLEDLINNELSIIKQRNRDIERAEELMTDINNFGKSFDEIMKMVQDEKVIPFKKPDKKAMGGRVELANGGTEDDRDEIAFNLFGKPYVELDLDEREELKEEMIRLRNKFMATGGRVGMQPGGLAGLAKMLMSIMRKGDEKQIKGVIRDPKTDLERLKDTDPKQPTIRDMEDLPGKLGYDKRNTRKLEELVEREKVRAILADRMGVDPKEISEVDIDMAIREGMGMFSKGGGVGSLFRRK